MQVLPQVSVKIGGIGRLSRTPVRVNDVEFAFDIGNHSFEVTCAKVEQCVVTSLREYEHKTVRPDVSIYLKPSSIAAQKDFVTLTPENFLPKMQAAQSYYKRRTKAAGPFVVELFVFAVREDTAQTAGIRCATASWVQEAEETIDSFLGDNPNVEVGEIARTRWAMTHARRPKGSPPAVPVTVTFRQMQHLDAMRARSGNNNYEEVMFQAMTIRLNGSSDLQLSINAQELRQALDLPVMGPQWPLHEGRCVRYTSPHSAPSVTITGRIPVIVPIPMCTGDVIG